MGGFFSWCETDCMLSVWVWPSGLGPNIWKYSGQPTTDICMGMDTRSRSPTWKMEAELKEAASHQEIWHTVSHLAQQVVSVLAPHLGVGSDVHSQGLLGPQCASARRHEERCALPIGQKPAHQVCQTNTDRAEGRA